MSGESPRQLDFRVAGALVGQRLDKALCGLLPDLSRAAVQRAITAGPCRIDGLPVSTASLKLKAGQEVRLDLPDTANELRAEDDLHLRKIRAVGEVDEAEILAGAQVAHPAAALYGLAVKALRVFK